MKSASTDVFQEFVVINHEPCTGNQNIPKTFLKHLLAGGIAGAVSRTVTAPFDRIKVFYQVSRKHTSMVVVFRSMYREGGIRSFWRGNLINVVKSTPKASIRFAFYDYIKIEINEHQAGDMSIIQRLLAGSLAGWISQTCIFPLEVLKVRMNLSKTGQFKGIIHAIITICKTEGIRSFGRGYVPTLISIVPNSGMDLAGYEYLKKMSIKRRPHEPQPLEQFLLSSISSMIGQVATYPLSLVATRMQAAASDSNLQFFSKLNTRQIFLNIWKTEGIKGMFRGLVPNMIKFVPVAGITFVIYEHCSTVLGITMTQ